MGLFAAEWVWKLEGVARCLSAAVIFIGCSIAHGYALHDFHDDADGHHVHGAASELNDHDHSAASPDHHHHGAQQAGHDHAPEELDCHVNIGVLPDNQIAASRVAADTDSACRQSSRSQQRLPITPPPKQPV